MDKIKIDPRTFLYPMPTVLVGANVDGKPNYITIAYCGIVNHRPPCISVASSTRHYTNKGIRENGTFSINIPSADQVLVTDYCGITSGNKVDKSVLFEHFYGDLGTAPMIKECALNLECKVIETVVITTMEAFIGEITAVYSDDRYLTEGLPDITKIDPIIFAMHRNEYYKLGDYIGPAYKIGENFVYPDRKQK